MKGNFTVVSTSTTGIHPEKSKLISITALKVRDWEVVSTLVRPVNREYNETKCVGEFMSFAGKDMLVGYNLLFDLAFLDKPYRNVLGNKKLTNSLLDMRSVSLLNFYGRHGLKTLIQENDIEVNAKWDIRDCMACLEFLKFCTGFINVELYVNRFFYLDGHSPEYHNMSLPKKIEAVKVRTVFNSLMRGKPIEKECATFLGRDFNQGRLDFAG